MGAIKKKLRLIKGDVSDYTPKKISSLRSQEDQIKDLPSKAVGGEMEKDISSQENMSPFIPYKDFYSFRNLGVNKKELEAEIKKRVDEELQVFRKKAQEEAYKLGFEQGKKEALKNHAELIQKHMKSFHSLIDVLNIEKDKIIFENESMIIKLIFLVAKKIALRDIQIHKEFILNLLHKIFEILESKTKIILHLSKNDVQFIQSLEQEERDKMKKDNFKKVVLQPSSQISPGGCLVETNYSEIDAKIETRLEKVWDTMKGILSKGQFKEEENQESDKGDDSKETESDKDDNNKKAQSQKEGHEGDNEKNKENETKVKDKNSDKNSEEE